MKEILQKKHTIALTVLLLICLGLRLTGIFYFWQNGSVAIQSPDGYYHLRRVILAFFSPPIGSEDLFRGLNPDNPCIFTIYYDMFYAAIIFLFSLGKANLSQAELIASFVPPFIGTISALVLFLICRAFGVWTALFSVAVFMILPKNISVSVFAEIDHHCFEVLFFLGTIYSCINMLTNQIRRNIIIFSVWLTALFMVWVGSTFYAGLITFSVFLWGIRHKNSFYVMFQGYLIAGIALLPLNLFSVDTNNFKIEYNNVSLFQPLFLITIAFFFYIADQFEKNNKIKLVPTVGFLGLGLLLSSSVINGLLFIFAKKGGYDYAPYIGEFQPLSQLGLLKIVESLTPFLFLAPFAAGFMFIQGWKDKTKLTHYMIGINFFIALILTIQTQRFLYLLSIFIAPVIIWGIAKILDLTERTILKQAIIILSTCAILIPVLPLTISVTTNNFRLPDELYSFYDWVKRKTPESGDFLNPRKMPLYSILSYWDQGFYLIYLAHRPSVSDNIGYNAGVPPLFYLSQSEEEAGKILKSYSARYVMVSSRLLYDESSFDIIGVKNDQWQYKNLVSFQNQDYLLGYPTPKFLNSIFMRLYFQDSKKLNGSQQDALQHFRLVYESKEQVPVYVFPNPQQNPPFFLLYGDNYPSGFNPVLQKPARYKLFEYVPGAILKGKTGPNQKVKASVLISSNRDRKFTYTQNTDSDKNGVFKLIVPYGKAYKGPEDTTAITDYTVTTENKSFNVTVNEADVLGNKIITVTKEN